MNMKNFLSIELLLTSIVDGSMIRRELLTMSHNTSDLHPQVVSYNLSLTRYPPCFI